ncbi:unnamed protein product, partial [Ranitomeya imitator]
MKSTWALKALTIILLSESTFGQVMYEYEDEEDTQAGCRTAMNDLVFIVDGSWSVGYADFDTAKNWLINITSSFDIGPAYTQRTNLTKNKIAIVVTDGKSQDDVVEIAAQARAQDIIMFAVGVGSEITKSELVAIANSPSTDYVLYAEDYTTIDRIKETMQQKICE